MKSEVISKLFFSVALALVVFALGCSSGNTKPDSGTLDADGNNGGENDCPVLCTSDDDCCDGQSCHDGVCSAGSECPSGCNYECDKTAGEVCNPATKKCETGAPPVNCVDDCSCYAGESCIGGQCKPMGGDEVQCDTDDDCDDGYKCQDHSCRPSSCQTREDCAGPTCLVCKNNECTAPPPVCQGNNDCCVGFKCNFGTCTPESTGCQSDSDCDDPEFPRCNTETGDCIPECVADIDCPLAGYVCIDNHCVSPGCTPEQCQQGQWCDVSDGNCKPGCDANDDCTPPQTCNYNTHECGQVDCCGGICNPADQYCDNLTCQCINLCTEPDDCPENFDCDTNTGKCMCTDLACPAGSHCDANSGDCVRDGDECDPTDPTSCPAGYTCDPNQRVCISQGHGGDGDPCFSSAECDASQNLYCDSNWGCFVLCSLADSSWNLTFTCRYGCSPLSPNCQGGTECHIRWFFPEQGHPGGLCIPPQ